MKTNKQDIQDLLSQLAADIEEIKMMLNNGAAGTTASDGVAAGTDTAGKPMRYLMMWLSGMV